MCRREGVSLCGRENCAFTKRPYPPGQHGPRHARRRRRKLSPYGIQLREKQKAKRMYQMRERQFIKNFKEANKKEGNTAQCLVDLLERRLDNVVYRLGFAKTRPQARQMVNHGFFTVNGERVDIPSYRVSIGDEIAVKESKQKKTLIQDISESIEEQEAPKWLARDIGKMTAKVTSAPEFEDTDRIYDPTLIVEFYSR